MANENLKDFSIQWVFFGLLFFCLLTFAVMFVANNNTEAFGESANKFDASSLQSNLIDVDNKMNPLSNVTADTNPEVSDLGSRDSVAVAYGQKETSTGFIESTQMFMGWIFTGDSGAVIIATFISLFSITSLYFIIKSIRTGT